MGLFISTCAAPDMNEIPDQEEQRVKPGGQNCDGYQHIWFREAGVVRAPRDDRACGEASEDERDDRVHEMQRKLMLASFCLRNCKLPRAHRRRAAPDLYPLFPGYPQVLHNQYPQYLVVWTLTSAQRL
jgi:hypothetical protein